MSTNRLVIRIKLIPQEPPPAARLRLSKSALVLMIGASAVALGWFGIRAFKPEPTISAPPVVSEPPPRKPVEPPVQQPTEVPTSVVHQVIPDVPRSALNTIRGTVRVAVRVTVDKRGTVVNATADDPGPSRYFKRLAVEAAKGWTFTPANSETPRAVQLKFNFTRGGVTALAQP